MCWGQNSFFSYVHYILTTINSCKKNNLRAKINDGALVIECLKNKKQSDFFLFFTFTTYFPSFFQFWRTFRSLTTKVFTKTPESVWILWTKKVTLLSSHYTYNLHNKLHWKRLSITHTLWFGSCYKILWFRMIYPVGYPPIVTKRTCLSLSRKPKGCLVSHGAS